MVCQSKSQHFVARDELPIFVSKTVRTPTHSRMIISHSVIHIGKSSVLIKNVRAELDVCDTVSLVDHIKSQIAAERLIASESDPIAIALHSDLEKQLAIHKAVDLLHEDQLAHLKAAAENQAELLRQEQLAHSKAAAENQALQASKAELHLTLKKSLRALRDSRKRSKAKQVQLSAVKKALKSARRAQQKTMTEIKYINQRK